MSTAAGLTNSDLVRVRIEMVLPEMQRVARALEDHPRLPDLLPDYFFATHCMIRASVPLMEAALERSQALAATDPVAAGVAAYLGKHIREERHHDEWLLSDLEVLGFRREDVLRRQPSATVAAMVGSQYYWIFHHHPVGLLGYIAVMEGYPPSLDQVDRLVAKTGYPRDAFRTMIKHAHLDPHHRDDLNRALDSLLLEQHHLALVGLSALETVRYGTEVAWEIIGLKPSEA